MEQTKQLPEALFFPQGKRAILLLHAYTGSYNDVRMLARGLESKGYTVYAPLFSGHGTKDPRAILAQSPSIWWQDTLDALTFLREKGYQQIAVFGLSMGGLYSMATLAEANVIGGGAFCSPLHPAPNAIHKNFLLYAKHLLKETIDEASFEQLSKDAYHQLASIEKYSSQLQQVLEKIEVPVFLAQAGQDQLIDPKTVFQAAQALKQTRCTIEWYPKSGHVITVGPDRKELEKDVLCFIESLSWNEDE
ncbi:alpha/beta hydrolase [Enterococcus sp. LJL98]